MANDTQKTEILVGGLVEHAQEIVSRYFSQWNLEQNGQPHHAAAMTKLLQLRRINYYQALMDPTSLWLKVREDEVVAEFVIDGAIDLYFQLAVSTAELSTYLLDPIVKAYGWINSSGYIDSSVKDRAVSAAALKTLLDKEAWVTFLLVFQKCFIPIELSK